MTWLYVPSLSAPASEDSTWGSAERSLLLERSATLRGKPSASKSWLRAWKSKPWMTRLFGRISRPSTASLGAASWISSLAATPVSPSAWLEVARERMIPVTSGPTCDESSKKSRRRSASSRTSPDTYRLASRTSFATWKLWATALRQVCSQRRKSAPRTGESGCSSWPTMTASCADKGVRSATGAKREVSRTNGPDLCAMAVNWPTPRVFDAEQRAVWPTPTSGDAKASGAAGYSMESGRHEGTTLTDAAVRQSNWSTPRANEHYQHNSADNGESLSLQSRNWATPAARDWKSDDPSQSPEHSPPLGRQVLQVESANARTAGLDLSEVRLCPSCEEASTRKRTVRDEVPNLPEPNESSQAPSDPTRSSPEIRREVPMLRGDGGSLPLHRPHQRRRTPAQEEDREHLPLAQEPRIPEGIQSPLPELQCISRKTGRMPAQEDEVCVMCGHSLGRQVLKGTGAESRKRLNPLFVEWLMNLPIGWTGFEPLATASSRLRQPSPSGPSRESS